MLCLCYEDKEGVQCRSIVGRLTLIEVRFVLFFFIRGLIPANVTNLDTRPVLRKELIISKIESIASDIICLRDHVGKGSSLLKGGEILITDLI